MLDNAYASYISSDVTPSLHETLDKSFKEIADALENINFEKVSVTGNPAKGLLRVAFRLVDNLLLSVIKTVGLHPDGIVGFNIICNRQLLMSDIGYVTFLPEYIKIIQYNQYNNV